MQFLDISVMRISTQNHKRIADQHMLKSLPNGIIKFQDESKFKLHLPYYNLFDQIALIYDVIY